VRHQRLFFIVVIGSLLVVLAIFAVIALVEGDETDDQGVGVNPGRLTQLDSGYLSTT
jgi:hypothetical protein